MKEITEIIIAMATTTTSLYFIVIYEHIFFLFLVFPQFISFFYARFHFLTNGSLPFKNSCTLSKATLQHLILSGVRKILVGFYLLGKIMHWLVDKRLIVYNNRRRREVK